MVMDGVNGLFSRVMRVFCGKTLPDNNNNHL
ncbi:MAG TPA: hypothetical protein DEB17_02575 [Chlorobaculum sp.]|uniref:Uncharacterized protein n=1 Tax=Chlorobaculum tepidum (strain ATCC 49652 / DSM 12025 / NBRC 103806 / TLS) TaxID=194439 RepID=Q8KEG5_CHLTE|nr:hypothetical protein CT0724 [Chlorobaculum tepidum TLS]HBU22881.1 hypothetical protein [Chlorobaculum sp.]